MVNDCETCKHNDKNWDELPCDGCCTAHSGYEADAISRRAVKELYYKDGYIDFRKIYELPPVNPQPKTEHWIEHKINGMAYIECSKCSSWFLRMYLTRNSYCPNCGAWMVEPQESEE